MNHQRTIGIEWYTSHFPTFETFGFLLRIYIHTFNKKILLELLELLMLDICFTLGSQNKLE